MFHPSLYLFSLLFTTLKADSPTHHHEIVICPPGISGTCVYTTKPPEWLFLRDHEYLRRLRPVQGETGLYNVNITTKRVSIMEGTFEGIDLLKPWVGKPNPGWFTNIWETATHKYKQDTSIESVTSEISVGPLPRLMDTINAARAVYRLTPIKTLRQATYRQQQNAVKELTPLATYTALQIQSAKTLLQVASIEEANTQYVQFIVFDKSGLCHHFDLYVELEAYLKDPRAARQASNYQRCHNITPQTNLTEINPRDHTADTSTSPTSLAIRKKHAPYREAAIRAFDPKVVERVNENWSLSSKQLVDYDFLKTNPLEDLFRTLTAQLKYLRLQPGSTEVVKESQLLLAYIQHRDMAFEPRLVSYRSMATRGSRYSHRWSPLFAPTKDVGSSGKQYTVPELQKIHEGIPVIQKDLEKKMEAVIHRSITFSLVP